MSLLPWFSVSASVGLPVMQSVTGQPQLLLRRRPWWSLREAIVLWALRLVEGDVVLSILGTRSLHERKHELLDERLQDGGLTGRLLSCSRSPRICTSAGNIGLSLGSPCQQASMMPYLPAEGSTITTQETWSSASLTQLTTKLPDDHLSTTRLLWTVIWLDRLHLQLRQRWEDEWEDKN